MTIEFNEEWPKRMSVTKVITYDLEIMYEQLVEANDAEDSEVTFDDIVELVEKYAIEDFSCGWGHNADISSLIFQDENGEEY